MSNACQQGANLYCLIRHFFSPEFSFRFVRKQVIFLKKILFRIQLEMLRFRPDDD